MISRGQPTRGGSPTWVLDEVPTILSVKTGPLTKRLQLPQACIDPLVRSKQWKRGMWSGMWNGMSLYRSGSITTVAKELAKYKLDLVSLQGDRWNKRTL